MKWIKASERLPEEGVHILSCKVVTMPTTLICSVKDNGGIFKDVEGIIYPMYVIQWLDEEPYGESNLEAAKLYIKSKQNIDWVTLEAKFKAEYFKRLLNNNPMLYWEIVQFFKDNI